MGESRALSGERTGVSFAVDTKAVELAHPTDKTGITTLAHAGYHGEDALLGFSLGEIRKSGDFPTSEAGRAEIFGQVLASEVPDLSETEAEKFLNDLFDDAIFIAE